MVVTAMASIITNTPISPITTMMACSGGEDEGGREGGREEE